MRAGIRQRQRQIFLGSLVRPGAARVPAARPLRRHRHDLAGLRHRAVRRLAGGVHGHHASSRPNAGNASPCSCRRALPSSRRRRPCRHPSPRARVPGPKPRCSPRRPSARSRAPPPCRSWKNARSPRRPSRRPRSCGSTSACRRPAHSRAAASLARRSGQTRPAGPAISSGGSAIAGSAASASPAMTISVGFRIACPSGLSQPPSSRPRPPLPPARPDQRPRTPEPPGASPRPFRGRGGARSATERGVSVPVRRRRIPPCRGMAKRRANAGTLRRGADPAGAGRLGRGQARKAARLDESEPDVRRPSPEV